MSSRALLYRRPSEPQAIEVIFDRSIYLVRVRRHRQARRYTLRIQAATREVMLTIPPRGSLKEAREFAQKHGGWIAARLGRLPEAGAVRARHRGSVARRAAPHRASARRARHGLDRDRRRRRAAALRRRRGAACRSAVGDFLRARSQARSRSREPALRRRARRHRQAGVGARPVEPLGLVFDHGRAVLFVAAHPGAALSCSTISRRTRSRISSR